ncbi:peptidylprolyl isomerase [Flavivirga aquatica]|uniref:Peptidyl-prolyl cis-trans isomerase n=1 Tax=Flavivirga aquatica TaxID=1849968 RepID=A0A1E5SIH8_9FLAO|nr:FKBP-type peptidyl-prolyl cis-trans isomerase [Flavivirga aquatica]OEJ98937.1 peptidylprolyl isomerase [Flavivirga aquatica]
MKNILIVLALTLFISCSKDDEPIDFITQNDQEIMDYITTNNLNALKSASGLYYVIDNPGSGKHPTTTDNVKVTYKGYYTNGSVFDENTNGIEFNLQQVIKGWTEGITYFKEGGSGILLIPAHLGYGNSGRGNIPGGSVLIFDINLISIN